MKTTVILFFILSSAFNSGWSGQEINFRPGSLIKELKELGCYDESSFREITLPHSQQASYDYQGKFFRTGCNKDYLTFYIGRVNSCRAGGCSAETPDGPGIDYEFFDYYVLYDNKNRIVSVKVFNYEATHGHEITVKGWLRQFIGYDGSGSLRVGKEVDSISGATVSVYSLVNDIRLKTELLKNFNNGSPD